MEICIFCGSTRKSAPYLRFFGVPKEPGLKRIQWLYVLGDRDIGPKDRVCAIHFRQGKPSNDPSHEDFVPHLNLTKGPTENTLQYLESLDSAKDAQPQAARRAKPSILQKRKANGKKPKVQDDNSAAPAAELPNRPTLIAIPASLSETIRFEPGQEVIIKQYKIVKRRKKVT